jgi:hypothetical protein
MIYLAYGILSVGNFFFVLQLLEAPPHSNLVGSVSNRREYPKPGWEQRSSSNNNEVWNAR